MLDPKTVFDVDKCSPNKNYAHEKNLDQLTKIYSI